MSRIHFLNVGEGDCIIIEHEGSRHSMIDICGGNRDRRKSKLSRSLKLATAGVAGNYQMCEHPVHPFDYLNDLGLSSIWRFISTHPDMDHLDGLDRLFDGFDVECFWSSGVRREKPSFEEDVRYREEDWDRYESLRDGEEPETQLIENSAGASFKYANEPENGHDGMYIRSPNDELIDEADDSGDFNDASYVIQYKSPGADAVFPGDCHDATWEYVLDEYRSNVTNIAILAAPHHGRKSGRSYDFLDTLSPTLTIFGCAPSEDLAYGAWRRRDLDVLTTNRAGCIIAECGEEETNIFIENESFAEDAEDGDTARTNDMGFYYPTTL